MIDIEALSDDRLKILIDNHREKGRCDSPVYARAIQAWNRRKGGGLDFETSLSLIWQTARERRFLCYKDLADANGLEWSDVRFKINDHLWALVDYAHRHCGPMISAVIVNKTQIGSGRMDETTLKGFVAAAEQLGFEVDDPARFLEEQQEACFRWAAETAEPPRTERQAPAGEARG